MPSLVRQVSGGVALLRGVGPDAGVTVAFTERAGGVSGAPYESLNLGVSCGDDASAVAENRRRALAAVGAADLEGRLVSPRQVHGDHVVAVRSAEEAALSCARREAEAGADAVVCTAEDVPVLLCFADCVPVVLTCPAGFAVAHSGWRGTIARIAATAARALMAETGCGPDELTAFVGPHIGPADYEVSPELLERFREEFGAGADAGESRLDLAHCVRAALEGAGVAPGAVACCDVSTASATDRFFSYRAEGGACGRHGALAVMRGGRAAEGARGPEGSGGGEEEARS